MHLWIDAVNPGNDMLPEHDLNMQTSLDHKNTFHTYASIFVLALVAVLFSHLFWNLMMPRMDFYNELWGPAYLLVHGQSPYDTSSLNPDLPAAWLPMAIGFFFPLGWLSENLALQIWYIFNILEICLIVYFSQGKNRYLYNTVAVVLICIFFPPTLNHINLGQLSITITLGWVAAAFFLRKDKQWASVFCIAVAMSKPHLGILAMLGVSYRDYLRGGLRLMFSSWARILTVCLILSIPLFVAYPNWIPDAIISMGKNPPWLYPSLYILFERSLGAWGHILWGVTTLIVIGANFWVWKKLPVKNAVYWSLALAPLVTPYVGSWDFVVVFPLLISVYVNVDWKRKAFLWMAYCIAWALMARVQMLEASHNHYFWWVPLFFIVAVILVTDWKIIPEAQP
jgi:hypothetical protein